MCLIWVQDSFLFQEGFSGEFLSVILPNLILDEPGVSEGKLKRNASAFILPVILILSSEKNLKISPLGKFDMQKGYFSAGAGAVFESKYLSVNSLLLDDNEKNIDIQTGFSINSGKL